MYILTLILQYIRVSLKVKTINRIGPKFVLNKPSCRVSTLVEWEIGVNFRFIGGDMT